MRKTGYFTKMIACSPGSLLIPGLLLCLLTLSTIFTYANDDQHSITLNVQNASLEKVFAEIEKQTHFSFLYMQAVVKGAKHVNVKVSNATIEKVLEICFKDQPQLTYSIMDRVVVVKAKPVMNEVPVKKGGDDPIDISGKVSDDEGKPLVGANVKVRGANAGVVTDAEGKFTLKGVEENAVLEISYVGHEPQLIYVKGQRLLAINLKQNQSMLDETVVIAYGTTTKRLNTGNIARITAKEISNQPINNPLLSLQGRVPGLFITQATGMPGTGVTVRIQGQNSISRGNDPLYVIDGVPFTSQLLPSLVSILGSSSAPISINPPGNGTPFGNPLNYINPNNIESIEVLKDADATAIYGSRAAAGAILITTKKGKAGKTRMDINIQNGWGKVTRNLKLLNTEQYHEMRNEAFFTNDGLTTNSVEYKTAYDINGVWDQSRYTNWQKELIGGTAKYNDIQLSMSGGNSLTSFLINASYHRETTVFPGDLNDRKLTFHFNLNHLSPNKKFKLQFGANYLVDDNRLIAEDLTNFAIKLPPNSPALFNDDGSLNWQQVNGVSTWYNPLSSFNKKYNNNTKNLIGNVLLSYQIIPGLDIKSSFGYNNLQVDESVNFPHTSMAPELRIGALRSSKFSNGNINSWIIEPQITYNTKLGRGTIEVLLGTTVQQNKNTRQAFDASGFNSDLVLNDIKSAPTVSISSTLFTLYKYNAAFGRINYNLQNKYIFNLTVRRDGSSRFGSENLFHNFGSIGWAWIFSNESFLQKNMPKLSFGKFRMSYGTTGNDQIGDYQFLPLYNSVNRPVAYQNVVGLNPAGFTNPYLQWEETRKLQAGLDLGFWNDRVFITATYFYNRSSNQLQAYALPIITGRTSIDINFPAIVQNYGWEFTLNTTNLKVKKFSWISNINLTVPKNKLVDYRDLSSSSASNQYIIGQPITILKAYQFYGLDPATGIYQFVNANGDITSTPSSSTDRIYLYDLAPNIYGGIQNIFNYKGFQLDATFQFVKQLGTSYILGDQPGLFASDIQFGIMKGNQPTWVLDRWQKAGDVRIMQKYSSKYPSNINTPYSRALASDLTRNSDASYIRLKNISLSWQVPDLWLQKIHVQDCNLYFQGQNLLTITNYKGLDPETRATSSLPPLRVLVIGLRLGL